MIRLLTLLLTGVLSPSLLCAFSVVEPICVECLNVRIGPPTVIRGPFADELDTSFSAIRLRDGQYRGFSANGDTYAIAGDAPWSMGGQRMQVLTRGAPGSSSECGRWLNNVIRQRSLLFGFVHTEQNCGKNQTHKSMSLAISRDEGLHWWPLKPFLTGMDAPTPGQVTGEGDCGVVDGGDRYYYAYCLRQSDWRTIVARAPVARPTRWRKFYEGTWSQPGRGGEATALGEHGTAVARWSEMNTVLLFGVDPYFGGVKLSLSQDKVTFSTLPEPLLLLEGNPWVRPANTELIAYVSALNYGDASNQITSRFLLSYVWLPPSADFDQRYLVFRDVTMWLSLAPISPQVGIAYGGGFLMTRPPSLPAVKIEECADHTLQLTCSVKVRTAGWAYRDPQPDTSPLFNNGELLGYVLNN